jgi:hypothetical protein
MGGRLRVEYASELENLHFHDLRHHDFSILFEKEYQIQVMGAAPGHSN